MPCTYLYCDEIVKYFRRMLHISGPSVSVAAELKDATKSEIDSKLVVPGNIVSEAAGFMRQVCLSCFSYNCDCLCGLHVAQFFRVDFVVGRDCVLSDFFVYRNHILVFLILEVMVHFRAMAVW